MGTWLLMTLLAAPIIAVCVALSILVVEPAIVWLLRKVTGRPDAPR